MTNQTAQHFVVDSKFRLAGGTSSDFHYRIELNPAKTYTRITVAQIVLPVTFYQITTQNNTFKLTEGVNQYTVTMPVGNYNIESLKSQLQTQMNAVGANTYTVTSRNTAIEPQDNKLTYSYTGTQTPVFITEISNRLSEMMGLSLGVSHELNLTLVSDKAYSLNVEQSIFLWSDAVADQQPLSINLDNGIGGGTLSRSSLDYINDSRPLRISRGNVYSFRLTNEDLEPIDLNGQNMTLELLFF